MKKPLLALLVSLACVPALAVNVTFDGMTPGVSSFSYDADSDSQPDAVFTSQAGTFGFSGPGPNQLYINEPGLVASTVAGPEIRVDFPNGASGSVGFSFAMSSPCLAVGPVNAGLTGAIQVYDSADNLLGTAQAEAVCTSTPSPPSSFVEAQVTASFSGVASYALVDFGHTATNAYILDNFNGTFGSTENPSGPPPAPVAVPTMSEWSMIVMAALMALGTFVVMRRRG